MNETRYRRCANLSRPAPFTPAALILASALAIAALPPAAAASPASVARGRHLAETHCKACHAIAGAKASPVSGAPPFARLQQRHLGRNIEEIFADGTRNGHPPMPSFSGAADQLQDLLDYVRSVQVVPLSSSGLPSGTGRSPGPQTGPAQP